MPLVSVIVPVYNVETYLRQCLDSIIGQTYSQLEIILVDDGSTDSSGAICDEYARLDSRIHVIHKANGGLSSARNAGLDIALGEYISFVDSDDWLELEMYQELVSIMEERNHLDLVKFGYIDTSKTPKSKDSLKLREYTSLRGYMKSKVGVTVWNALYRHRAIRSLRFIEGMYCEDIYYSYKLFSHPNIRFAHYDRRYYHYRTNRPGSIMASKSLKLYEDIARSWPILLTEIEENKALASLCHIDELRSMEGKMLKEYLRGDYNQEYLQQCQDIIRKAWQVARQYPIPTDWDFPWLMLYIKAPILYWICKKPMRYLRGRQYLVHR